MSSKGAQQGHIQCEHHGALARVTIANQPKFNAMSRAMWRELRVVFERIQHSPELRCVLIAGQGAHFCAGGDISEYAAFRFQEASLRDFHEHDVWGALQAMLDCDVPIVAQISGNCMGAGVEIASCCDIRLAAASAQFGAPIARLGFPMAPREAALVARELGLGVARQMLLAAEVFKAADMKACGFLSQVLPDGALAGQAQATAGRIAALAPQAARLNKQTIRALNQPLAPVNKALVAINSVVIEADNAYAYATSTEHREGIAAFLEKRKPAF
ncbi:MAG: enoyl-CoA hydratase/isomerase family protein [Gammaproteobacteria bacterium]|uniref:enoyl-CoA hydratase/isomerase family protein n=1 Tax=Rhodoferax sp. TaxID=50421 RepID=UPI0018591171|nr:enoyl-CoA hydratase/isomerase family protein [Rhodoferax sp.]MBU3898973.1 enoyl-CoA hydratase/isomerase family protein [Gammaproteobacteria bacterium]MBA3056963.1 enoyl-CoA hydratase/isomerase family protein [Rhodoferax sp.]MBU3998191.1 enoyl-CoA hydratase/isomerase family protein [Gammaproteobacteria bacterium]MBU4018416.1 enoyl-CoA hydratase/isomerase family protein [Gammaproteobacteria bacterium]MBU4080428.1 enoyl-CoA hydratase/isomerase family protein [Gammaproteobacteria bacterium]